MTGTIRLLADDLTGALDTAAELVGLAEGHPVLAFWHGALPAALPANASLDSGTRELGTDGAKGIVRALVPALVGAKIPYKKIDSLMRGPTVAEAVTCFHAGGWTRAILAPAFPYQGRATRGGVQHVRDGRGNWSPVHDGDIITRLRMEGALVQRGAMDEPLRPGISVFDADTDAELRRVVAVGREMSGAVLWMGTGGLAQALAYDAPGKTAEPLPPPVLGLFGSDQAVTARQLAACGPDWLQLWDGGAGQAARLAEKLRDRRRVFASLRLPKDLSRDAAARRIAEDLRRLVDSLPPPGTLIAAGGETLRGLCLSLGARALELQGRIVPGLPRSILRGGPWDGVTVVSKSGAFGPPTLLRDLMLGALTNSLNTETDRTP